MTPHRPPTEAASRPIFAHSLPNRPTGEWERLDHHLQRVGAGAAEFAEVFGWASLAQAAGRLHDIGKTSARFQTYIGVPQEDQGGAKGPDHSTAGAREAMRLYGQRTPQLGRMLAYAIAGHHAGLADPDSMTRRLDPANVLPDYAGWEAHAGALPQLADLAPTRRMKGSDLAGFSQAFLTRMLFSCLVDADFLETEAFYAEAKGERVERGGHTPLAELRDRLARHMQSVAEGASPAGANPTPINALRAEVLAHATAKAALEPGLFTLTVPTGGGKTLTSLSFALEHAVRHGLRRVVYVIPFTSIIEQTAQVFRAALDTRDDILEHHASFDWDHARSLTEADDEGPGGIDKLRRAAENWDAPVVVTTAVQFFESLFAARTSRCRKLHNLAGAVIVLDEAQSLPLAVLRPCLAALDELARNYGSSVVLCTATQPGVRIQDKKLLGPENKQTGERRPYGLNIPDTHELAPNPQRLYESLRRVQVEVLEGEVPNEAIAARFAAEAQMLCIVNSRAHARALFEAIGHLDGAVHLSTLMCPVHRAQVLAGVREALAAGRPARVVSTSLIEAGVDISFPEVWRASTGLESIAQAAGRCNRNDELAAEGRKGRVVVFTPTESKPPKAVELAQRAAARVLARADDPLGLAAIADYFGELYSRKEVVDLDSTKLEVSDVKLTGVLEAFARFESPFAAVAERFKLIDETTVPVIVPYDKQATAALDRLALPGRRPSRDDLRIVQRYTVGIPRAAYADWLMSGAIIEVRADLGLGLTRFANNVEHYRDKTGVDVSNPTYRSAESNLVG